VVFDASAMPEGVYKAYLKLNPADIDMTTELAALEYTLDKPAEAERIITAAEKSGPMPRNSYVALGSTLNFVKKYELSIKYYEKVLAISPRELDYYNIAYAYAKRPKSRRDDIIIEYLFQKGLPLQIGEGWRARRSLGVVGRREKCQLPVANP
jgi:tetratricopeptide (TPR) repeat protein